MRRHQMDLLRRGRKSCLGAGYFGRPAHAAKQLSTSAHGGGEKGKHPSTTTTPTTVCGGGGRRPPARTTTSTAAADDGRAHDDHQLAPPAESPADHYGRHRVRMYNPAFPIRAAFYYPWFPPRLEPGRASSPYSKLHAPRSGNYDSTNASTLRDSRYRR